MKKLLCFLFAMAIGISMLCQQQYPRSTGYAILDAKNSISESIKFCNDLGIKIEEEYNYLEWIKVSIPSSMGFKKFEETCLSSNLFDNIFEDQEILCSIETNDTFYNEQWFVNQYNDKDIDADLAWNTLSGINEFATIAVIDGHGFDTLHEDMIGNWDSNFNATNGTSDVYPTSTYEKHATPCAGIIGSESSNILGVAGLGNNLLKVMGIKIGTTIMSSGSFATSTSIQASAINAAMSNPNCVAISMSYGSSSYLEAFYQAITSARTNGRGGKGILVFASTGNNGSNNGWTNYPASYPGVIGVGSTTLDDTRSYFSNYGTNVDLSAPGTGIKTIDRMGTAGYNTTNYTSFTGTSAATPVAAAVGAMLILANSDLTEQQALTILSQTCDKVGSYTYSPDASQPTTTRCNELGSGRVNMNSAINSGISSTPIPLPNVFLNSCSVSPISVIQGQQITVTSEQSISDPSISLINSSIEYRISNDNNWSTDDIIMGNDISSLGGGVSSETESIIFTIPISMSPGTKYILTKSDATNSILESDELDNICSTPITIMPLDQTSGLDVSLSWIQLPSDSVCQPTGSTSPSVTYKFKRTNNGTVPITHMIIKWGFNGNYSSQSTSTFVLNPGSSTTFTVMTTVPLMGNNTFNVIVFSINGSSSDSNSSNNSLSDLIFKSTCISNANDFNEEEEEEYVDGDMGKNLISIIYPNPNIGNFNIRIPDGIEKTMIKVIDSSGKVCHQDTLIGSGNKELSLSLSDGLYFVEIENANEKVLKKMIVQ